MEFSMHLSENIFDLHADLKDRTYEHGGYEEFNISDPKPRKIHKATVRDRLLHHAVYRVLYPYFNRLFIHDSYSCRNEKGTHKAIRRFLELYRRASRNDSQTCWVLKCDVRKFFASIDHARLFEVVKRHNVGDDTLWLLRRIVESFDSVIPGKGLPLGNLTSQLLVNIFMNEFDQYMKHEVKEKYYIRFADDFIVMNTDRAVIEEVLKHIRAFLKQNLLLDLHPDKVSIATYSSGIDFLGWINFPSHRILRTTTKRRMIKALLNNPKPATVASYLGMLKHGNTHKIVSSLGMKARK